MYVCIHACFYSIAMKIFKTHMHLKMNGVRPWNFCSFYIGTLVVVQKRAVIEDQTRMRLVVAKDIIAKNLTTREVSGQKKYLPAYRHNHIFFESTSGKNPVTSCLESIKVRV